MENSCGFIQYQDQIQWAQLLSDKEVPARFVTGTKQQKNLHCSARRTVVGFSATQVSFRSSELPFKREEQLRAVMLNEIEENTLIERESPHLALHRVDQGEMSRVNVAITDKTEIVNQIARFTKMGLSVHDLLINELACWPLVAHSGLLEGEGTKLIVDQSSSPASILLIAENGEMERVRLVSPTALQQGNEYSDKELHWLLGDEIKRQGDLQQIILINPSLALQEQLQEYPDIQQRIPQQKELAQGVQGWSELRVAGLTYASSSGLWRNRLYNFRTGDLANHANWNKLIRPWYGSLSILAVVLMVLFGGYISEYLHYSERSSQLSSKIRGAFEKILPGVPMLDPIAQLDQAIRSVEGDQEYPSRALSQWVSLVQTTVPKESNVEWQKLNFENGVIEMTGDVPSYNHLDQVVNGLKGGEEQLKVEVENAQIRSKTKNVRFRIKVFQ